MTLVIMAAGMGSRFGGLKQIASVGPNDEFIIDYSIYDAIEAGFSKVIFIIKEENYEIFKNTIGNRIENNIEVEYVFQDNKILPNGFEIPEERNKPLGTGHALYCALDKINEPFAVISADDFYGRESFQILYNSMLRGDYSVIGYKIGNTLTENGSVKRGICFTEGEYLSYIIESKVERVNNIIEAEPLNGGEKYIVSDEHPVSMLMFGIQPEIKEFIKKDFIKFLKLNSNNLSTCEYLLPDMLNDYMTATGNKMHLYKTNAVWKGMTYATDVEQLKEYIKIEVANGIYPKNLYNSKSNVI